MRRSDREINEFDKMVEIMRKCDVCRLAFNDGEYPYILPLNFGMQVVDGQVVLYFHGAMEGYKYEVIKRDNRATFEMDCSHRLVTDEVKQSCTMEYESIIGTGRVTIITEYDKKKEALDILMAQYHKEEFHYNEAVISMTTVMKMTIEHMTGKARRVKT